MQQICNGKMFTARALHIIGKVSLFKFYLCKYRNMHLFIHYSHIHSPISNHIYNKTYIYAIYMWTGILYTLYINDIIFSRTLETWQSARRHFVRDTTVMFFPTCINLRHGKRRNMKDKFIYILNISISLLDLDSLSKIYYRSESSVPLLFCMYHVNANIRLNNVYGTSR